MAPAEDEEPPPPPASPLPAGLWRRLAAAAFGAAAAIALAETLVLKRRLAPTLAAVGWWIVALAAGWAAVALACPDGRPKSRAFPRAILAATFAVLLAGGWCRLAALAEVPFAFGGDEANQAADGMGFLRGDYRSDPFGTGWGGTVRLGMLPAGLGAWWSDEVVAGPRRPYAAAGTLALAGAAAAGGLAAGPWAALGAASLLAFAPHHVHFSRLASVMVLDSLVAAAFLIAALRARGTGSPRWAFLAAAAGGIGMYGYAGGRVLPVAFLAAAPLLVAAPAARGRRMILVLAIAAGFTIAAAPGIAAAAHDFREWNSRFNQTSIFRADWWQPTSSRLGGMLPILWSQFESGTVALLDRPSSWPWFQGYPIVGPAALPAFALAGLGWLAGRRRYFAALLVALVAAGNFAAVILTDSTPAPQRLSSLFPALAILGGAAAAGIAGLAGGGRSGRNAIAGTAVTAAILAGSFRGVPPGWDPSPGYGSAGATSIRAAAEALRAPCNRRDRFYLDGLPEVDSSFPLFPYFFPGRRWIETNPETEPDRRPEPGVHYLSPRWSDLPAVWRERDGVRHAVAMPDPDGLMRPNGYVVRVPAKKLGAPGER